MYQPPQLRRALPALVLAAGLAVTACGSDQPSSSGATTTTAAAGATTTGAAGGTTTTTTETQHLRDIRYCEVIPSVVSGTAVTTYVYNTLGQNYCPPQQWSKLTEDEVNQEYGSQSADLNGPRHWVLDAIKASGDTTTGKTFTFGGIEMNLRATLTGTTSQPTVGNQFYVPNEVARDTVWVYDAGKPIYQLTDPDGNVYVMQSYAQIADPTLTMKQLDGLASKLTLPTGWTYSTTTLTEPLELASDGLAHVVNDNLYNSYQRR